MKTALEALTDFGSILVTREGPTNQRVHMDSDLGNCYRQPARTDFRKLFDRLWNLHRGCNIKTEMNLVVAIILSTVVWSLVVSHLTHLLPMLTLLLPQ